MKKPLLPILLSLTLLFTACLGAENSNSPSEEQESMELSEELTTLETITDGAFTFIHKSQGGNYFIDVLYKDQTVGQFFKELPVDGWKVYVFKQTSAYAYLGLEPTGLGGYIPFGGPWELARVNLATSEFQPLIFNGMVNDISGDDQKLAYTSEVLPTVSVMNLQPALYPNGSNVQSFTPEGTFDYVGNAVFSPNSDQLAYVALEGAENESSTLWVVNLSDGTQTALVTQEGQLTITGWNGAEPRYE